MERKDPTFTGWAPRGAYAELKPVVDADPPPPPVEPPSVEPAPPLPAQGQAFARFLARPGLYRLLFANLALNIVTLTFYRFWARARLRRHLWSRVEVLGDPLEYTGTGGELFKGFLVALLFLVPLFGGFNIFLAFEPGEGAKGIATAIFYVAFALLYWVALFRTRRYRLSRTAWRGIRLGQTGSQWPFVFASMGWSVLVPLTLTLAVPFMRAWQARHLMNRTLVGDAPLACTLRGRSLLLPWLLVMLPLVAWCAVTLIVAVRSPLLAYARVNTDVARALGMPFVPWLILAIALTVALFIWYRLHETRLLVNATAMGPTRFSFVQTGFPLVLRVYGGLLLVGLAILVLGAATFGIGYLLRDVGPLLPGSGSVRFMAIATVLGLLVVLWIVSRFLMWPFVYLPLMRRLVGGLRADQPDHLAAIGQSRQRADKAGEGLADAFDVGFG